MLGSNFTEGLFSSSRFLSRKAVPRSITNIYQFWSRLLCYAQGTPCLTNQLSSPCHLYTNTTTQGGAEIQACLNFEVPTIISHDSVCLLLECSSFPSPFCHLHTFSIDPINQVLFPYCMGQKMGTIFLTFFLSLNSLNRAKWLWSPYHSDHGRRCLGFRARRKRKSSLPQ